MRVHVPNTDAIRSIPMGRDDAVARQPLLSRWCPAEKKYVLAELDWDDPLDAVIALRLVRFRVGVDAFDA